MTTKAERAHMAKLAEMGCCICRRQGIEGSPAQIHHIRTGTGMGKRAAHTDTLPLCFFHHQGPGGIHQLGRKAWERRYGVTELGLLAEILELVI